MKIKIIILIFYCLKLYYFCFNNIFFSQNIKNYFNIFDITYNKNILTDKFNTYNQSNIYYNLYSLSKNNFNLKYKPQKINFEYSNSTFISNMIILEKDKYNSLIKK
ncbi:hypothetical protein BHAMNSH16_07490 [Brachyspira hampsonii]|uniref:Uncharacterized protein n=1 Tax=Brachyspira hampsonii TaxID=1287055 RepID=A0AAC9TU29_9SPIR|nr:hypothetical protein BHAMNSH16_07490 [Brachyspira hampsonii]OEJ18010.1 hypothetical protein A9496_09395 [Brachyspira hampsonii]